MKSIFFMLSALVVSTSVWAQSSLREQYFNQQTEGLVHMPGCARAPDFCQVALAKAKVSAANVAEMELSFDRYFADVFIKLKTGQILKVVVDHERGIIIY